MVIHSKYVERAEILCFTFFVKFPILIVNFPARPLTVRPFFIFPVVERLFQDFDNLLIYAIAVQIHSLRCYIPKLVEPAARVTSHSLKPGVIAAISASTVGALLIATLIFLLCRRRRKRHPEVVGGSSSARSFMRESPPPRDNEYSKEWRVPESPPPHARLNSQSGAGWPEDAPAPAWAVPPDPVAAEHPDMTDVYGFGQDVAWKEAHYEDPLPTVTVKPPSQPGGSGSTHPDIGVVPPTPQSVIIHHNMPLAAPLVRSPSAASSVFSEYSAASMVPRRPPPLPPAITEETPRGGRPNLHLPAPGYF
ncbi:hypothetical protein B0H14DRAFT_3466114 [Mycena olivaceomarginata]|nr:hypothetical protein B0H14DRAFT_3466114 [Mycena olivaceomarginata]